MYGYSASVSTPPFALIHRNAWSMLPPLQPLSTESHETSSCSLSETRLPVLMAYEPSMAPMVEKAQHEPQRAWSLIGVTAPFDTQSMEAGTPRSPPPW